MSKPLWIAKAEEIFKFHQEQLKIHLYDKWTVLDTANKFELSIGRTSECLRLGRFLKSHREVIEKFEYARDALIWVKKEESRIRREE